MPTATSSPGWHFFTGPVPRLRAAWNAYNIAVQAPGPDADFVHSSVIYFIDPGGRERYLASTQADHTSSGASYLPSDQIATWGRGIAQVTTLLAGRPAERHGDDPGRRQPPGRRGAEPRPFGPYLVRDRKAGLTA
jgi:hypothetical protein